MTSDADSMHMAERKRPDSGRDVLFYLFIPTVSNLGLATSVFLAPDFFANALGASYVFSFVSFFFIVTSFIPTFHEKIADVFAIVALGSNVALFIVFVAGLNLAFANPYLSTACSAFQDCLYFSIVTFTTLGYGDFQPAPPLRLLAAFHAMVGYISLGFIIAIANDIAKKGVRRGNDIWGLQHIPSWFIKLAQRVGRKKPVSTEDLNPDNTEQQTNQTSEKTQT